ncbi:hypothetical protein CMI37_21010 [Candidatus Pacearchaeota archaeon]|nr:hypothetical protein [Candidatus Pacearchaeota archaeon]|tara:strand:- start:1028 stop:1363 length:336 start_codon:yes stop_codon:yes gene_type:complete
MAFGDSPLSSFFGASPEDFLVDDPLSAYLAFSPRLAGSPNRRRGFRGLFPSVLDEFRGQRARSLKRGVIPTQSFTNFLEDYPILQRYLEEGPRERGERPNAFAPRLRFNFG